MISIQFAINLLICNISQILLYNQSQMGKTEIILIAIASLAAIGLYNLYDNMEPHHDTMFNTWADIYSKNYNAAEKQYRKSVWMSNFKYVQQHNARYDAGKQSYNLEMNHFADLTNEQFAAKYLMTNPYGTQVGVQLSVTKKCNGAQAPDTNLPDSVDWAAKGAVTPIKNQGQCGSCWAFSTTGSLEGAKFKSDGKLQSFSQQQLVDCSHSYGNNGCNGGLMNFSFWYVVDHGITLQSKYPYRGVGGSCRYNDTDQAWTIHDCTQVTVDKEKALMAAVAQQPVSVAIQANHLSFQLYKSGVYNGNCGTKLDHGVLAVGYGATDGKNHWKVKNSWGATWGSSGYIYIARSGDGKGKCGIQMAASYPIA